MTTTQTPTPKVRNPYVHAFARGYDERNAMPKTTCKHCGSGPTGIEHKRFITLKQVAELAAYLAR
jgi:hypothetical protein